MQAGKNKVAVPTTVHCDPLILAQSGAQKDLKNANKVSSEVFNFLESVSRKYGIGFWSPAMTIFGRLVPLPVTRRGSCRVSWRLFRLRPRRPGSEPQFPDISRRGKKGGGKQCKFGFNTL